MTVIAPATTTRNLLVELLVEELPPKALRALGESFASGLLASLRLQGLAGTDSVAMPFATPRRLAAHVTGVALRAADRRASQKLMPANVGFTSAGEATPALLKKLASLGADASAAATLGRRSDGKVEALWLDSVAAGARLAEGLQAALDRTLADLPIPKLMSYQLADGWTTVRFVRPVHGLVALHGDEVVDASVLGLRAGRQTQGHRFEAPVDPLVLRHVDGYVAQLATEGAVIVAFEDRRGEIVRQIRAAAERLELTPIDDPALLDEVTALVERPNVLVCSFEPEFLAVPQECLILTMKANQKYFPLLDTAGRLTHRFLVVSNISPADPSRVVEGNERVVRPRLADARFFFDQDRKRTLASRLPSLAKVVYHHRLGSQRQRVERVRVIAAGIVRLLGDATLAADADRAALLAKADLVSDMVGEFPELQGTMGRYYALHDGESAAVADAIEDHYKPRFAGDALPRGPVGVVVALADKLETLVGLFGIGQLPTGDRDPFALRRHALGVIRMLVERRLPVDLPALVEAALPAFEGRLASDPTGPLLDFVYERLSGSLREQGYSSREVDAVLAQRPARLADVAARLAAVRSFAQLPEAEALAAANKRVANILRKVDRRDELAIDPTLPREPAEAALHGALAAVRLASASALERGDLTASLRALAALRQPVDAFFETVMVNVEDPALRANRLALLAALHQAMNAIADLSRLAG